MGRIKTSGRMLIMMSMKPRSLLLCAGLTLLAAIAPGQDPLQAKPEEGLVVGQYIPTTTMRQLIGGEDRNTCLAEKYQEHQTFAIYARDLTAPGLVVAAQAVDELLVKNDKARGYVLLASITKIDPALTDEAKAWWKMCKLKKLDVAVAGDKRDFGDLPETAMVTVIWSDKRIVGWRKSYESGRLGVEAARDLREQLAKLGRSSPRGQE